MSQADITVQVCLLAVAMHDTLHMLNLGSQVRVWPTANQQEQLALPAQACQFGCK